MNRNEFLNNKQVKSFIDWLSNNIDSNFSHTWFSLGASKGFKIGEKWSCHGIFGAHVKYKWKSKRIDTGQEIITFSETRDYLNAISKKLDYAITQNDSDECCLLCIEILKWGGVNQDNKAQNIRELGKELAIYLHKVQSFLDNSNLDSASVFEFHSESGKVFGLNLDSGTTKIYSLLAKNFIIYDSRVGAALCMLVRAWHGVNLSKENELTEALKFTWGSARKKIDGNRTTETRDPNNGKRPRLLNFYEAKKIDPIKRFSDNVHSSWLLSTILEKNEACGGFISLAENQRIHAFESALFMIGYSVSEEAFEKMEERFSPTVTENTDITFKRRPLKSKKETATKLFRANSHLSRREMIALFISDADLTKKGAATYYYNISRELN